MLSEGEGMYLFQRQVREGMSIEGEGEVRQYVVLHLCSVAHGILSQSSCMDCDGDSDDDGDECLNVC